MPTPFGKPDAETTVRPDPLRARAVATRARPEIAWTDAAGAHAITVETRVVVGSADRADVVVVDPAVSRLHAELDPRDDGLWVTDLGSTNGTFVDAVRVTSGRVPPGGGVSVGSIVLRVTYPPAARPVERWAGDTFGPLVGHSDAMRELFARLARVANSDATVLIHGETGTGKELVARALHEVSSRAARPFVVVDCGSIPDALLEGELFGHVRGAFTGAVATYAGAIESAEGGTVFLDEIGELPLAMQPKLLRVLESRTVRRLGEAQPRKVNVRFVTATHRDLRVMVNAGAFREDLYFRLAVVPIAVPPLRAHPEDIPALLAHFLPPAARASFDPALLRELSARPWPGNVRELRNFAERAAALGTAEALESASLAPASVGAFPPVPLDEPFKDVRDRWVSHLEREYLRGLLARHNRNITAVAQAAGLGRTYVYQLMRRYGL